MAITWRANLGGGGTGGTSDRTAGPITPVVGDLFIVFCCVSDNTNTHPSCTDNNGGTYTLIGSARKNGSADTISAFVRDSFLPNTTGTTVTAVTGSNSAGEVAIFAVAGAVVAGLDAIRQFTFVDNGTAGGTPQVVFPKACLTGNMTLNGAGCATASGFTQPSGWIERFEASQNTPTTDLEVNTRNSGFTGTTITWGATTATSFGQVSVELEDSAPGGIQLRLSGANTAAGNSVDVTTSKTPAEDDFLIAIAAIDNTGQTFTWPTGFTEQANITSTVDNGQFAWAYKKAGASETGSYTISCGNANSAILGAVLGYRGVHTSSPFDVTPTASSAPSSSNSPWNVTGPALASGTTNRKLVLLGAVDNATDGVVVSTGAPSSTPDIWLRRLDFSNLTTVNVGVFDTMDAAGTYTSATTMVQTLGTGAGGPMAFLIALRDKDTVTGSEISATAQAALTAVGQSNAAAAFSDSAQATLTAPGKGMFPAALSAAAQAALTAVGVSSEIKPGALSGAAQAALTAVGKEIHQGALSGAAQAALTMASRTQASSDLSAAAQATLTLEGQEISAAFAEGAFTDTAQAALTAVGQSNAASALSAAAQAALTATGQTISAGFAEGDLNSDAQASLTMVGRDQAPADLSIAAQAALTAEGQTSVASDLSIAAQADLTFEGVEIAATIAEGGFEIAALAALTWNAGITAVQRADYGLPARKRHARIEEEDEEILELALAILHTQSFMGSEQWLT